MKSDKTTIAISRHSRKTLGRIKNILERDKDAFVDMDETVKWLLDNIPESMQERIKK